MYNDYPTIYETNFHYEVILYTVLIILIILLSVITLISLSRIFKKANRSGISAFIPFYNLFVLLEIVNLPRIYILLMLIPGINIIFYLKTMFVLAKLFRKTKLFGLGLTFLPFIFYPILAFSNSEYIGINMVAIEGNSQAVDVPRVVNNEENNPVVNQEQDKASKDINISIGGGVYQKDYTSTLLQVDQIQTVPNTLTNQENINTSKNLSKQAFISPVDNTVEIDDSINLFDKLESKKEQPLSIEMPNLNNSSNQDLTNNTSVVSLSTNNEPALSKPLEPIKREGEFIICPKCGSKIKNDAKVCFLCGTTLE